MIRLLTRCRAEVVPGPGHREVVLPGLVLEGLGVGEHLVGCLGHLGGAVRGDQAGLLEQVDVDVRQRGVHVERDRIRLVLVLDGGLRGGDRVGHVGLGDRQQVVQRDQQAPLGVVDEAGPVHDRDVRRVAARERGVEGVVVGVPGGSAEAFDLDSPLVLGVELVGQCLDGGALRSAR